MTTEQVITRFLAGQSGSNGRISTDGTNLYSYSTLIAFKEGGETYVTQEKYSVTTTRHVDELYRALGTGWSAPHGPTIQREVSISVDKTGSWQNNTLRPVPYHGWKPRKGSVGYRPVDELDGGHTATFRRAIPYAV